MFVINSVHLKCKKGCVITVVNLDTFREIVLNSDDAV